jgi:hypothetical protein
MEAGDVLLHAARIGNDDVPALSGSGSNEIFSPDFSISPTHFVTR